LNTSVEIYVVIQVFECVCVTSCESSVAPRPALEIAFRNWLRPETPRLRTLSIKARLGFAPSPLVPRAPRRRSHPARSSGLHAAVQKRPACSAPQLLLLALLLTRCPLRLVLGEFGFCPVPLLQRPGLDLRCGRRLLRLDRRDRDHHCDNDS